MDADWCPDGWAKDHYVHGDHSHAYYVVDHGKDAGERPSVLLLHEFAGISQNLVELADTLAEDFRVVVPSIFGRDGDPTAFDSVRQLCVRREVHILAYDGISRSVEWLRDFAEKHVATEAGRPWGVIGMCFTGNFALALAVDARVKAAVVAEPALPLQPSGLGLSSEDRARLTVRTDLKVQGYRFRRDCMSPAGKLRAAQELLGSERMKIFTLDEPRTTAHSVLTGRWRNDSAIAGVRAFLGDRLEN